MNLLKQSLSVAVIGGWALLALCSDAVAEKYSETAPEAGPTTRAQWEQRSVRPSQSRPAGASQLTSPVAGTAQGSLPQRRSTWTNTRGVSTTVEPDAAIKEVSPKPEPSPSVRGDLSLQPTPMEEDSSAYDMPGEYDEYGPGSGAGCPRGGDCWCEDDNGCGGCGRSFFGGRGGLCLRNFALFAGVQGFKGPTDFGSSGIGRNGNFGFHEGVSWAGPLGGLLGDGMRQIGYQMGLDAVHSNFQRGEASESFRGADRNQIFLTAGLFRRALCGGLQWGVVYDFLHDRYFETADLKQIRAEISFVNPGCSEIGFWGSFGTAAKNFVEPQQADRLTITGVEPVHMYTLFYRRYFCEGGDARIWGGATSKGDGLAGGDLHVPLSRSWALENNFQFRIPKQGGSTGETQESWALAMHLVWYPGQSARCVQHNPYRPLLSVADNAVFMVDRKQH